MDQNEFLIEETLYRSRAACTTCWRSHCFVGKESHPLLLDWMSVHYDLHQRIRAWLDQLP